MRSRIAEFNPTTRAVELVETNYTKQDELHTQDELHKAVCEEYQAYTQKKTP